MLLVCRRGSPLVIGVKSATKLATDRFPVIYSKGKNKSVLPVERCDISLFCLTDFHFYCNFYWDMYYVVCVQVVIIVFIVIICYLLPVG